MKIGSIKEEHLVIGIFAIVLLVVIYTLGSLGGENHQGEPEVNTGPYVDPCKVPITASCKVVVERDFESCKDRAILKKTMSTLLAEPEKSDACQQKLLDLESHCSTGCMVDYSSLYQLSGDISTDIVTRTQKGCLARGSVTVNMRANCITNPNYREPEVEPEAEG